jgi:hypothetical protein
MFSVQPTGVNVMCNLVNPRSRKVGSYRYWRCPMGPCMSALMAMSRIRSSIRLRVT